MATFNDARFDPFKPPDRQFIQKARPVTLTGIPSNTMGERSVIKHSTGVDGILARLFNIVCLDISNDAGISPLQWNRLTNDYIQLVIGQGTAIDRMSIRGNLNKALRKPSMTWDVFCKGLVFLKYRAFKVTIVYRGPSGQVAEVSRNIHFLCEEDLNLVVRPERREFYKGALKRQELEDEVAAHLSKEKNKKNGGKKPYAFRTDLVLSELLKDIRQQIIPGDDSLSTEWKGYVTRYVDKDNSAPTRKKKTHRRGNVTKAVKKKKISWKTFCEGIKILNVSELAVVINGIRIDSKEFESIIQTSFAFAVPDNTSDDQPDGDSDD